MRALTVFSCLWLVLALMGAARAPDLLLHRCAADLTKPLHASFVAHKPDWDERLMIDAGNMDAEDVAQLESRLEGIPFGAWDERSIATLARAFGELELALGPGRLAGAMAHMERNLGRVRIMRVEDITQITGRFEENPIRGALGVAISEWHALVLSESFFRDDTGMGAPVGGEGPISIRAETLLHEIAHLVDRGREFSYSTEYLTARGWRRRAMAREDRPSLRLPGVNPGEVKEAMANYSRYKRQRGLVLAREYSHIVARHWNLPTVYAATNPVENFAEDFSHILLSPRLKSQIPAAVVAWFNEAVFQ